MFEGRIELLAGDWRNPTSPEYQHVLYLAAALAATESIGGKKGTGLGRLQCRDVKIGNILAEPLLIDAGIFEQLKAIVAGGVA